MKTVKTPAIVKTFLSGYVWNIETNQKVLYLTFDDGPTSKITTDVLTILNRYHAKATFFCIGKNVEKHPEIVQQILAEGHVIGNHTYEHLNGWKTDAANYVKSVAKAEKRILQINNSTKQLKLFRPPYGRIKPRQAKRLQEQGYKVIMWDVLSYDWDLHISKEKVLKNVIDSVKNGSIIVFHDSLKAAENVRHALPKVLAHFSKKGYRFESIT